MRFTFAALLLGVALLMPTLAAARTFVIENQSDGAVWLEDRGLAPKGFCTNPHSTHRGDVYSDRGVTLKVEHKDCKHPVMLQRVEHDNPKVPFITVSGSKGNYWVSAF